MTFTLLFVCQLASAMATGKRQRQEGETMATEEVSVQSGSEQEGVLQAPQVGRSCKVKLIAETILPPTRPCQRLCRPRAGLVSIPGRFKNYTSAYRSPASPSEMDWSTHYPAYFSSTTDKPSKQVEWADVGCGFGGLLMALAPQFPDTLMLGASDCDYDHHELTPGMEIRVTVTAYVRDRILAARQQQKRLPDDSSDKQPGGYNNVSVIRANSMKHMPNFFSKGQVRGFFVDPMPLANHQLTKVFFLFPDPHFKLRKQKARIVT